MKKYKKLLITLLVFLCCLSVFALYTVALNIYYICDWAIHGFLDYFLTLNYALVIVIHSAILAFSILGIVTVNKILKDKQLFTDPEQPATPTPDETQTNKE